jgi:hypothetical protein
VTDHLTHDDVRSFLGNRLPRQRVEAIGAHVASCDRCAAQLDASDDFSTAVDSLLVDETRSRVTVRWRRAVFAAAGLAAAAVIVVVLLVRPTAEFVAPHPRAAIANDYGRAEWNGAVRVAIATRRLDTPATLDALRPPAVSLRGAAAASPIRIVSPAGTVVESDRPHFAWRAPDRTVARIVIASGDNVVMTSEPVRGTEWTAARPLERGTTYDWQVRVDSGAKTVIVPAPGEPPARFRVLDAAAEADVAAARARGDRRLLIVILAKYGLVDEARAELAHLQADPQSAQLARAWDASLPATAR